MVSSIPKPLATLDREVGRRVDRLRSSQALSSPVHDERVAARIGAVLGLCFVICFVTGVVSHLHQHPVAWLPLGPNPSWGYRLNQGLHVATGLACVPLLLAKLFAVYPNLLAWPPVRGALHALERTSVGLLVGAALFQVSTGVMNIFQWYPWGFGFTTVHWIVAWVAIGSVVLHVAVHLPAIRRGLATRTDAGPVRRSSAVTESTESTETAGPRSPAAIADAGRTRRGFLVGTGLTVVAVTVGTIGQTVAPLGSLAVLAPRRPDIGPQGLPVNRSSAQAGVGTSALDPTWSLELVGPDGSTRRLARAALLALPQHQAVLPVACVEGWSASARWGGVRIADLVALSGGGTGTAVSVTSLEQRGAYRRTELPAAYAAHPDSLLALRLGDEDLDLEHGFPARIIAPNRPGVLQTKWVARLEVSRG